VPQRGWAPTQRTSSVYAKYSYSTTNLYLTGHFLTPGSRLGRAPQKWTFGGLLLNALRAICFDNWHSHLHWRWSTFSLCSVQWLCERRGLFCFSSWPLRYSKREDDAERLFATYNGAVREYHSRPADVPRTGHRRQRMRPVERLSSKSRRMRGDILPISPDMESYYRRQLDVFWDVGTRWLPVFVCGIRTFAKQKDGNASLLKYFVCLCTSVIYWLCQSLILITNKNPSN